MLFKNVANQKIHVYAYDSTTGAAKTGDAANITAYVSLDGTANAIDDTNPAEVDATNMPGIYCFDLAQAETNCNAFALYAKSSTSNIRIEPIIGFTTGAETLNVNASHLGGTAQTGRDIGASVLLSSGTGTGQLDFTSGVVKSNLVQILASALSGTAAQIAAAFVKFFDKASPTGTVNSLPDAVPGANGGLPTTNGTKINQTVDLTAGQIPTADAIGTDAASKVLVTPAQKLVTDVSGYVTYSNTAPPSAADIKTALEADGSKLDHLWEMTEDDAGVRRLTTNALEQAPSGGLDAAGVRAAVGLASANLDTQLGALPTAAENADAVWDEALSGHTGAGTAGNALATASSGGVDPSVLADAIWDEALSGHSTAGTTGKKLTDLTNADLSGVATASALAVVDGIADAIKAKTDNLPSDPADQSAVEAAITAAHSTTNGKIDAVDDYIDTEVAAIKAKTDLIPASPAAVGSQMDLVNAPNATAISAIQSGLSTLTAQQVWEYATRTLSSFGTLAADVWASATRTLTAISDSSGITTLLSRISGALTITGGKVDVNDKTGFSLTVTPPTAAEIKTAMEAVGGYLALTKTAAEAVDALTKASGGGDLAAMKAILAKVDLSASTIVSGAAVTGTLSTTEMTTDLTEATNDHYNGRIIIWTSGVLKDQATDITDYDGATKKLVFTAVTEAPSNADTFVIL